MARSNYLTNEDGELYCPFNRDHALSADREPYSYYCYKCGEHYLDCSTPRKSDTKGHAAR